MIVSDIHQIGGFERALNEQHLSLRLRSRAMSLLGNLNKTPKRLHAIQKNPEFSVQSSHLLLTPPDLSAVQPANFCLPMVSPSATGIRNSNQVPSPPLFGTVPSPLLPPDLLPFSSLLSSLASHVTNMKIEQNGPSKSVQKAGKAPKVKEKLYLKKIDQRYCTKCDNHRILSRVKGHKAKCEYRNCNCEFCIETDKKNEKIRKKYRETVKKSMDEAREYYYKHIVPKFVQSIVSSTSKDSMPPAPALRLE